MFPKFTIAVVAMSLRCLIRLGLPGLCIALFALAGCSEREHKSEILREVKVAQPLVREVNDWEYFIGRTGAVESVDVQAQVTGALWSIDFVDGTQVKAEVKKGQRLFKIDPRTYQAAYDQAVGQVNLAKARLTLAIADYKRALEVAKTPGAISQQDIDKYAASEGEARAEVAAQEANAEAALINLKFTDITSPIDGRASRNLKTKGNIIKQNETLLATVVSEDPIYVYFDVDDQTMMRIKRLIQAGTIKSPEEEGALPIDIGLSDEKDEFPHRGYLNYVSNELDATTGTIQIRGKFANPKISASGPRLLEPDQFVRVRISLGPKFPALLVPQAALGTDQGKKYLLVVTDRGDRKNVVEYRPVKVGPEEPGGLQVVFPLPMVKTEEGLQPATMGPEQKVGSVPSITAEDKVIIDGLQFAPRGKSVNPKLVPLTPPEEASSAKTEKPKAKPPAENPSIAPGSARGTPPAMDEKEIKRHHEAEVPLPPAPAKPQ
ncbi:MAG: efflux RND transporter periplasmic adaptor subunit [Planctomycetes bacterium]|nr:efflux RND transporter periplasmic adaptor subunit [Planctomycetota bacterium]